MPPKCFTVLCLLFASLLIAVTASLSCQPSSFTVPDVQDSSLKYCVYAYNFTADFCQAVRACHSNGQELISRRVFESMRARISDFLVDPGWWVGLTDSGDERDTRKDGWVWILDGHVTGPTDSGFNSVEPNNYGGDQDCVVSMSHSPSSDAGIELRDATCTELNSVYCYSNSEHNSAPADQLYQLPNSPVAMSTGRFIQSNGNSTAFYKDLSDATRPVAACWQEAASVAGTTVRNRLMCSHRCQKIFPTCLGFYWQPTKRECVIIKGNDSIVLLPHRSIAELMDWQKYLYF